MGIVRFDPMRGFEGLARRMNEMAGEFEKGVNIEFGGLQPRIDISEDEKNLFFAVEMPGISKEDIKIKINDEDILVIKGEKKREFNIEDKSFIRAERCFGEFTRSFLLPDNVNKDSIQAKYENGVLNITLEKIQPEKPKEVEISIN
jgi:HSP20 family protein